MNIVQLPVNNLNDVAVMARRFADDVEAGVYGKVNAVVLAVDGEQGLTTFGWGDADDGFKVFGMFHAAASTHVQDMFG